MRVAYVDHRFELLVLFIPVYIQHVMRHPVEVRLKRVVWQFSVHFAFT